MYIPPHFDEPRVEALHDLITKHPLGALVTHSQAGLDANHIPFDLHRNEGEFGVLQAHVARNNPVWREARDGDSVLVIFRASDAYVSPTWYPSKHEFHNQVPTWNYMVAHAHGRITVHDDEKYVRGVVARLTREHEASQPVPWKMRDATPESLETMMKAIVGLQVTITSLVGKFKLSQNRERRDRQGAAEALGEHPIGRAMRARETGE